MPRRARVVVVGHPHHITQRGNNRQPVFFCDDDRRAYLDRMFAYADRYDFRVWAYCLMNNHIHVVGVPQKPETLSKVFGRLHADYARAVNFRREGCGHLWQERFYSCPMELDHAWTAMAYVEQNPQRSGLNCPPEKYRWSSAKAHLSGEDASGRLDLATWRTTYTATRWREVLATGVMDEQMRERFLEATLSGKPFGSTNYLGNLEDELDINFHQRKRPTKASTRKPLIAASASGS